MPSTLQLAVALPELTLAVGAMALLMVGVATRKEQAELVLWLAVLVLALAGFFVLRGQGTDDPVRRQLHRRSLRPGDEAARR